MKQSAFKAELNQYYYDADGFFDLLAKCIAEVTVLNRNLRERMKALGVEDAKEDVDLMYDIVENENDARKEGKEPVRRVFYHYEDTDAPLVNWYDNAVWIEYTEDDYLFLRHCLEDLQSATSLPFRAQVGAMNTIADRIAVSADFVAEVCISLLHKCTKDDCKEFLSLLTKHVKALELEPIQERSVIDMLTKTTADVSLVECFLAEISMPFTETCRDLRREEYRQTHKKQDNEASEGRDFVDYVFTDAKRIHEEQVKIIAQWYGTSSSSTRKAQFLRHDKLARTKEINALQTLNLARDNKGIKHESTARGGLQPFNVFENKDVEIMTPRIEDVSLSTNTRQILDYFFFKGVEQIPHKGSIERLYKNRAVRVELDELATVFSIDKKDARKRLNSFYDEVRDLKIKLHYVVKDGKKYDKYVATVNIFDADLQKIDQEDKNATARPEDVEEGVQITLYNTGTLLNYDRERKKAPKNAVQRGQLTMQFSMDFARHLSQASVVRHNPKGYLINRRKYASSYSVQCTLENHAYMNRGKTNEGVISLGALLNDCYEIPTYETVMNGNRNITARIKKPLLSSIQALKDGDVLRKFHYCDPMKRKATEDKVLSLDYDDFINCTLHFTLSPIEE